MHEARKSSTETHLPTITSSSSGGGVIQQQQQPYRINSSEFQTSVVSYLGELYASKVYTDVMLHAEGQVLAAHRIILAAGSAYFKSLFATLPAQHQSSGGLVVALPNVKYRDLELLVSFIYHGYVDVVNEDLEMFIKLAKELKVVGMDAGDPEPSPFLQQDCCDNDMITDEISHAHNSVVVQEEEVESKPLLVFPEDVWKEEEEESHDMVHLNNHHGDPDGGVPEDEDDEEDSEDPAQLDEDLHRVRTRFGHGNHDEEEEDEDGRRGRLKPFACLKCGKTYNSNKSLWRHKKFTCDEKIEFRCVCGKVFSRSDNLRRHVVVAHHGV